MRWSIANARVAGIKVYAHVTFIIFLAWIALAGYWRGGLAAAFWSTVFMVLLFGIVVLHELGHALTARYFGIRTREIILLPIGGIARLERIPRKPIQEFWVALAGPAVNVVLAALLYGVILLRQVAVDWRADAFLQSPLLVQLFWVNVILALFNLLPAFPMDGGRILRSLLAMRLDYVRATQMAAAVGQGMAMLFGLWGLLANPFLIFIALFVWIGAAEEAAMAQMESALSGIPVELAMITEFHVLAPDDPLEKAAELVLAGFQHDFPVVEDGRVVGILTRADLLRGLTQHGQDAPVRTVMSHDFETADAHELLDQVLLRLQQCRCRSMPVLRDGELVGILTPENLSEYLMIREALARRRRAARTLEPALSEES